MTKNRKSSNKSQLNNHNSTADHSSNDSSKFKDDPIYGPTTRKAWSEWCKTATTNPTASKKDLQQQFAIEQQQQLLNDKNRDQAQNGNHHNHRRSLSSTNNFLDVDK